MILAQLTVNGRPVSGQVEPRTHLADFLREQLRLTGTHLGCEHGVCGACTVLLDGVPVRSCITLAAACQGAEIQTIEGFDDDPVMGELRQAFSREHGLQCGFCTPGMLIAARDIVLRVPGADEARIRTELAGNLCRCTGYRGIVRAVASVATAERSAAPGAPAVTAAPFAEPAAARAEMARFTVTADPPALAPVAAAAAPASSGEEKGWTTFADSFVIAAAPEPVWRMLADFPLVAACLPGAELTGHDGRTVKGSLRVRLGPISAAFAGSAAIERDEAARTCLVKGAGSDGASRSRTRGELTYRVVPEDGDRSTRVLIDVRYNLQGPLAQFSRSGIALELARRLLADFAANLNARVSPGGQAATVPAARLQAGRLLWSALWAWARGWFRSGKT
jgi:carbon-monoxide dehydrogenase small subunit